MAIGTPAWYAIGASCVLLLAGLQVAGRAMQARAGGSTTALRIVSTGTACPAALASPPAWTRSPAAYTVAMGPPVDGTGVAADVQNRPLYYGTWRQGGWRFELTGLSSYAWSIYGLPLWRAFHGVRLQGVGVVRAAFSGAGFTYSVAWRRDGCHSATLRATQPALARWVAAR